MFEPVMVINAPLTRTKERVAPTREAPILATLDAVPQGFSALLINDHDPKPRPY